MEEKTVGDNRKGERKMMDKKTLELRLKALKNQIESVRGLVDDLQGQLLEETEFEETEVTKKLDFVLGYLDMASNIVCKKESFHDIYMKINGKYMTEHGYHCGKWEDGKEALTFRHLESCFDEMMGWAVNGYDVALEIRFTPNQPITNPVKKEEKKG